MAGLGGLAVEAVGNVGASVLEQALNEKSMETSYRYQKNLNRQMANLSREARVSSAGDMVEGLRRAGLSPALASGGSFGSVSSSGGVAPLGNNVKAPSGALGKLALEEMRYNESERGLMSANAESLRSDAALKAEQARGLKIDNDNRDTANKVSSALVNDVIDDLIVNGKETSRSYQWAVAIKNSIDNNKFNLGTLNALHSFLQGENEINEYKVNELSNKLQYKILANQVYNDKLVKLVSEVPSEQAEAIKEQTTQLIIKTSLLMAQLDQTNAETENIKAQKAVINKTAQNLDTLIRSTHHKDLISMWEDGEYMQATFGTGLEAMKSLDGLIMFLLGKGRGSKSAPAPSAHSRLQRIDYDY